MDKQHAKQFEERLHQIRALIDECLRDVAGSASPSITLTSINSAPDAPLIVFDINSRAFFKRYALGKSGPKKFVLVVAYLSRGEINKPISWDTIKRCWNEHEGLLGGKLKTGVFGTRAKESGWIDTSDTAYVLTTNWGEIL